MTVIANTIGGASTSTTAPLPVATTIDPVNDLLAIYTNSLTATQAISRNVLLGLASQPLGLTDTQSPTNKTFNNTNSLTVVAANLTIQDGTDNTKQAKFVASGITTGTTRSYTLPNASDTLVGLAVAQNLTNKTLTSPVTITISNTGGLTTDTLTTSGNASIGGTLGVTGVVTLTSNLTVGGTLGVTGAITGPYNMSGANNPYKFSVYWAAGAGGYFASNSVFYILKFDTKPYDTSNNFNTSTWTWTVPMTGIYHLSTQCLVNNGGTAMTAAISLCINGSQFFTNYIAGTNNLGNIYPAINKDLRFTAGDTVTIYGQAGNNGIGCTGGNGTFFDCFLVSAT